MHHLLFRDFDVTPTSQSSISDQVQRVAAEISARLAQVAKDPPDLAAYFRVHAEVIVQALQPVGLAYEMMTGGAFQRAFAYNYDSLNLRDAPAQELAFQRAVRKTVEQAQTVFLDANWVPETLHGLEPEDSPAPESLPPYNKTAFQQIFAPIPLSKKIVGVLHAWFIPGDATMVHARAAVLARAAAEIELYLKARRISDISQELARISTYAHFLEDVAGDQDLEAVSWKLVNYAREAVGCDRVCLLIDSRYGLAFTKEVPLSDRLALQACSGLRKPHPRSEQAEILRDHAAELLKLALSADPAVQDSSNHSPADGVESPAQHSDDGKIRSAKISPAEKPSADARPRMRIMFTMRDPSKTPTRPEAVNHYFDVIPMNWSTVIPLYDRENRVCATLLFEGQQSDEKMAALFMQMRDLAVSGGRALSTALVWNRRRTLRFARKVMGWRDTLLATSNRRLFVKYGVPAIIVIGLLGFPFSYRVRGDATLRPTNVHSVAALTGGRLTEVNVREGDRVKKGQVLCVLDSTDLQLALRQVQQDRERSRTEAQLALRQDHSEARMRMAQLQAERYDAQAEKLQRDIDLAVIRAPFDGILIGPADLVQRRGQVVRIGETVAEIVDPSQWEVKVSVREQDIPTLTSEVEKRRRSDPAAGVPAELVLLADPNRVYHLKLSDPEAFAQRLDTTGGKYSFTAVLPVTEPVTDASQLTVGADMKMGYTGKVRFACGRRPLAQILFGDFVRFMKVFFF
jgi:RND family efflux transporter MFP subunit